MCTSAVYSRPRPRVPNVLSRDPSPRPGPAVIAVYVSGHGFGHATRVGEVLRAVRQREPTIPLSVVSSTPPALFRSALGDSFVHRGVACDVGLAQQGAL